VIDWLDALAGWLRRLVAALHPRNLCRTAEEVSVFGPLAVRSVKRRLARSILVSLSFAAGTAVYLGLAASFNGAAAAVAVKTAEPPLPADVIVVGVGPAGAQPVAALDAVPWARDYEVFDCWTAETSLGRRLVVGLTEGGRLEAGLGLSGPIPAGKVFVPRALAAAAGVDEGAVVEIGLTGSRGFVGRPLSVGGVFTPGRAAGLFADALVVRLEESLDLRTYLEREGLALSAAGRPAVPAGPDSVAVWERDPGDTPRLVARVRKLFPGADVQWPGLAAEEARRAAGGFFSPAGVALSLVFFIAGLGAFNVLVLSLLQRKTELGVLKAIGASDDEVFGLILLEGAMMAATGTLLGLGTGVGLVGWLNRISSLPLHLTSGDLGSAVGLAAFSFYLAAWLPGTLCRRASPVQLVGGRRLYLNPRSTCAQCGRCGGF